MKRTLLVSAALLAAAGAMLLWANRDGMQLPDGVTASRIVVDKSRHTRTLYSGAAAQKIYTVAIGSDRNGNKEREGDRRTPEGVYRIASRNAGSRYHRALLISYPNASDRARGATGGDVEIHGVPNTLGWIGSFAVARDWTAGCIAMRNSDVDELWRSVPVGTPIEIRP